MLGKNNSFIISLVTIKKIAIEYTQKEVIRELKCFSAKKQTQNKTVIQEMRGKKAIRHKENK